MITGLPNLHSALRY